MTPKVLGQSKQAPAGEVGVIVVTAFDRWEYWRCFQNWTSPEINCARNN